MKKKLSAIFWTFIFGIASAQFYSKGGGWIIFFWIMLACSIGYFISFIYYFFENKNPTNKNSK